MHVLVGVGGKVCTDVGEGRRGSIKEEGENFAIQIVHSVHSVHSMHT